MSTTWPMRLDLDAERHLPREWWAEGEDDCLPDGVGEEEAWALIRRSAAPSYHSITLAAEHAVVRMQDAATATRTAASAAGASREPAGGDRVDEGPSEAAHPGSVLLRPSEVAKRLALSESRIYELIGSGALGSVTIGRSRRVPLEALTAFIADLADG